MLQFSNEELESRVTAITIRNTEADVIEDAINTVEKLFMATPAECHRDLVLLAEALTDLRIIKDKIKPEEGFEKIYSLYRRESENG